MHKVLNISTRGIREQMCSNGGQPCISCQVHGAVDGPSRAATTFCRARNKSDQAYPDRSYGWPDSALLSASSRCLPHLLLTSMSLSHTTPGASGPERAPLSPDKCYKSPSVARQLHRPLTGHAPAQSLPSDLVSID